MRIYHLVRCSTLAILSLVLRIWVQILALEILIFLFLFSFSNWDNGPITRSPPLQYTNNKYSEFEVLFCWETKPQSPPIKKKKKNHKAQRLPSYPNTPNISLCCNLFISIFLSLTSSLLVPSSLTWRHY